MKTNKPSKPSKTPPKPLIHNKKAMKKIVAKHEDIMGFFEKIKVGVKVKNKKTNEKANSHYQNTPPSPSK